MLSFWRFPGFQAPVPGRDCARRGIADLFGDIQTGNPLASGNVFAFGSGLTDDAIIGTLLDPVRPVQFQSM